MPQPIKSRKTKRKDAHLAACVYKADTIRLTRWELASTVAGWNKSRRMSGCWPQKNLLPLFPGGTCSDEDTGRLGPSIRVQGSGRFCRLSNYMGSPTTPRYATPPRFPLNER